MTMHNDALFGDPTVAAAMGRFAARMRPQAPTDAATLFGITILFGNAIDGITSGAFPDGVQGLVPIPMRGRPVGWLLDEVLGGAGDLSLELEYGPPTNAPDRVYTTFTDAETPTLTGASTGSSVSVAGAPPPGWPLLFEYQGAVRVSVPSAPTGAVKWVLLTLIMAKLPVAGGLSA